MTASTPEVVRNGGVSFWHADVGGVPARRPGLAGEVRADVCIVGAGFTGLWTAYYLRRLNPRLSIAVVEQEFAGFGASGRNGGNLTGRFPWSRGRYRTGDNEGRLLAMERALRGSVDEILRVIEREQIEADALPSGNLQLATNAAQAHRLLETFAFQRDRLGLDPDRYRILEGDDLTARIRAPGAVRAIFDADAARIQPAKLVRGLAAAVERLGVRIYEGERVARFGLRRVDTDRGGIVRADVIVRATEGFTPPLPHGGGRQLIPLNSAIIITEPLDDAVWNEIGWAGAETLSEQSHLYTYCQKTRGGRITVGGRGVPYRFGSGLDLGGRTQPATIDQLLRDLRRLFPAAAGARIDQAWCGVLGVTRDWCARVGYDAHRGEAFASGYVGGGIAASNLAGRTLADLILERPTERTGFPWVDHAAPTWEPEPLRWLGVHAMYQLYALADAQENAGARATSPLARLADRITGKS